jgi:co-chaperonin GroES (HSP10)
MKAFKLLLKEPEKDDWGYEKKGEAKTAEVMFDFKFKTDTDEIVEVKKGDIVMYHDDYPKKINIDGVEYISPSVNNLVCLK